MKPVTIIGGGLAGLALGIRLRQEKVPVTVIEAGRYPRHRVCGEFLSGKGRELLKDLGVYERAMAEGALEAHTARFYADGECSREFTLPTPAFCFSRYRLDALLADEFVKLGGELRTGERYTGEFGEGVVRATGRQAQTEVAGWRWIGLKAHAKGIPLAADLEMHLLPDAYIGLCRVEGGEVNICGLFRTKEPQANLRNTWRKLISEPFKSTLTKKFSQDCFLEETFCAVAALPLQPFEPTQQRGVHLGDSFGMIPPVTGNGMSLAIESAFLMAPLLIFYAQGQQVWADLELLAGEVHNRHFGARLRWASRLQSGLFQPTIRRALFSGLQSFPSLFPLGFRLTHD